MYLLTIFVGSITIVTAVKTPISKLTTVCSRTDQNFDDCVTKSANEFIPQMVKGIRDYALPPIDPLKVPFMQLSQSERPVGLKLNISDTTHEGIRNAKFSTVKLDLKKHSIDADLIIPRYTVLGTCDVGGRILLLPISGHGACNLTSDEQGINLKISLKPEKKNGQMFYKVEKFLVTVKFVKGYFKLDGLFGGNVELGRAMNRFLNENAVDVLNEMKTTLEAVWGELFGELSQRILSSVPIDQLVKS